MLWPDATALPIYCEPLVAALPVEHPFAARSALDWASLADETILVQTWAESEEQREFFDSLLGGGDRFQSHAASKQSVLALVSAGFGITITCRSQSEKIFPGGFALPPSRSEIEVPVHRRDISFRTMVRKVTLILGAVSLAVFGTLCCQNV